MPMLSRTLAAGLLAASVPWFAAPAAAAPLSAPLALQTADTSAVETVQNRRGRNRGWIGPAAGFAAGVAIGSALAARPYYYAPEVDAYAYAPGYTYDPGYAYVPVPGYVVPAYPSYRYYRGRGLGAEQTEVGDGRD